MKITKEMANKFDLSPYNLRHKVKDPSAEITPAFCVAFSFNEASKKSGMIPKKFIVCESFYAAMVKAKESLTKVKGLFDIEQQHSMYLVNGVLFAISHAGSSVFMCKIIDRVPVAAYIIGDEVTEKDKEGMSDISEFDDLLGVLLFKQFSDIETVFVKAGDTAVLNENRYKNQSKSDITVLDSTWFRNIVRSEGFLVSGHFRFQPFGEGRNQKKLIWIDEFSKSGYSRIVHSYSP